MADRKSRGKAGARKSATKKTTTRKTAARKAAPRKPAAKAAEAKAPDMDSIRAEILTAALPHVVFDGWSIRALTAGAKDCGHDVVMVHRAFPGGATDAIELHSRLADEAMLAELERRDLEAMKIRERIATAVRVRLEQNAQHREAVSRGVAFLALPPNAPLGAKCLYRTVDAMWIAAGDTSTDYNFYTKRGLLAGVYSSTLMYWLNDKSDGFENTWAFLDRRIANVMQVPKMISTVGRMAACIPSPLRFLRPRPSADA